MQKLELLSPAKDYNTAICAINSGADAIYIGAQNFGARKSASNSLSDIKKIIDYAHLFNVKVYVTINTILNDEELEQAKDLIFKLYEIKTDAIIVQDFGILYLSAMDELPPIALHASTQCDIKDLNKVKFFEELGLKRVILAREISLDKIQNISKNSDIELEHFIHGALCVSYSGQCYISYYIGGRSANKGECAQACRKKYSLVNNKGKTIAKNQYLLSLKDNNLSKHLDKLIKSGIVSFKIEGRLKDENYVRNITRFYHKLLEKYPRISEGIVINDFEANPEKSFNRGFCDDYLFNKKDNIYNFKTPKSMGEFIGIIRKDLTIKTKKELHIQDGLYFENNEGCFINKLEKTKDGYKITPNKKLNISSDTKVYRNLDTEFNKTLENSKTSRKLEVNFKIYKDKITVSDTRNNKIEFSIQCSELAQNKEKMKDNFIKSLSKSQDTPYLVKNIEFKTEDIIFLPVSKINEIRRTMFDMLSKKILSKYKPKTQKPLNIAKYPQNEGDYRLNCHNKKAKEFYELCGCKVQEMSFESQNQYKNKELMRTLHCLKRAFLGCENREELFLVDEKNVKFPLVFDCKNCEMVILAP